MQEPKVDHLDLISLCVPLTVCPTPHAGHCIGRGQADGGWVPPQAQECAALSGLFRAGGFSPCRCHPGFRSCLRGSRWLPGQPWFSQRRKEARGGAQSVPCPQAPDLQVTPFPPVPAGQNACLVATPRCKGVWKARSELPCVRGG